MPPRKAVGAAGRLLAATVALAALVPAVAVADATGPCHCYRDRSFDPARPRAADPYILASTRSSLLSAVFGPSKRELVEAVMTGTSPDDLWIAYWVAARSGRQAASLLGAKDAKKSWKAVLGPTDGLGKTFEEAIARGSPDGDLAALAVDDVLGSRAGVDPGAVAALREMGATTSEVILAVVLASRIQTTPTTVLAPVKSGNVTWGAVLQGLGLTPKTVDDVVRQIVSGRK